MKTRASIAVLVMLGVMLLGGGAWGLSKTHWFDKRSKQAATSTQTTETLIAANAAQGGAAAAYVQVMGEVAATLPASKEKDYLGRAGGIALSYLPTPDPKKIIEAQALKIAVLNGQLELADKLTSTALQRASEADMRATRAISAKRASDTALTEAAAKALGAEQNQFYLTIIAIVIAAGWAWTKLTHASPLALSRFMQDVKSGTAETNPTVAAMDGALTPFQQMNIKAMVWARDKLGKLTT